MKKIIALLLTLALALGTAILPSPALAKGNSNEFQEADYRVENADGASYKVYEFTDVVGKPAPKESLKIGDLEISQPRILNALQGSNPSLGEEIPDADSYAVDVQWTTYDLAPDELGTPVFFQIYDTISKKIIARTEDVTQAGLAEVEKNTPKGPTYKYKFKKLPAWDDSDVSHDPKNWQMRAPNEYRFDVRLRTATQGRFSESSARALINQRGMPIYRAEYYTNKKAPTIEVQRTNKYDKTNEVPINPENLTEDQYYSWAEAISSKQKPFFKGRLLDIQKYGFDTLMSLQVSDDITAERVKMAMKAPGHDTFDRGPGTFKDNGTDYHYLVTGNHKELHIFTIRQDLKVNFDANGGTWKTGAPAEQTIGHSMKLADEWAGLGPITVPGESDLTPPAPAAGEKEKKFIGWNTEASATTALFKDATDVANYTTPIKDNTTFYAIYQERPQGIAKAVYKDKKTNAPIADKYKIAGKDYPAELKGNKDEAIAQEVLEPANAPKFIGYKAPVITTDPVPEPPASANYTENGDFTVIYTYEKLPDIIPAKTDDGNDNPLVTPDVKATYIPVTIKVDSNKGQLKKGAAKAADENVYYVNPVEGKSLQNVLDESGLTAEAKDTNVNQIDTVKPWKFAPTKTKADADVAKTTEVNKDNFEVGDNGGVTMEVNFKQSEADKLKDKLKPVDIKVWQNDADTDGSKIDWKKGVALKAKDDTLQGILDKAETKVSDLGEGGTLDAPKTSRNSSKQNLPDGKVGNLKVAFEDGSSVVVENQKLYVAPHKNVVKEGEPNQIDPNNLPDGNLAVKFLLGEGVKIGDDKVGNGTTPVLYETYYVKPGTSLEKGDIPATTLQDDYKGNEWYNGTAKLEEADYKNITEAKEFTAKAVLKGQGSAELAFVDDKGNAIDILGAKKDLKLPNQDYVQASQGKDGTPIAYDKNKAPKILGYEFTKEEPVISPANFKEGAKATITLKYKKIDDIIGPNKPADQKPEGYVTVAFKATTGATLDPSEMSYFVNPKADVKAKVSKVGDKYQISGTKADGTDLTGNVPTVDSADASKYEIQYAGTDKKWAYDNFDQVGKDITADTTFTAQVITLGKPFVKYPDIELAPGQSKEDNPEKTGDRYGNPISAEKIGAITVAGVPEGVTVTPDQKRGKITVSVSKDYKGSQKFEVKLKVKVDGIPDSIDSKINVTVKRPSSPGGGGYVIPSKPEPKPEKPSEGDLNKDDHYQYLIGYPDGTFAPNRGMTRAEVATMFTRLLKDRPVKGQTYAAGLSDVYAGDWYADTVGYAVQKGIVSGYPDGSFKPNQAITRAEFASIASRFAELTEEKDLTFSDLDASHWGYKAIRLAASNGWISGYPDNTFRPEQAITRAEVTSITNRILNRYADLDWINAHNDEVIHFSDVSTSDWFFEPIMEATMGHDFTRDADGKTEHWTGLNGKTFI